MKQEFITSGGASASPDRLTDSAMQQAGVKNLSSVQWGLLSAAGYLLAFITLLILRPFLPGNHLIRSVIRLVVNPVIQLWSALGYGMEYRPTLGIWMSLSIFMFPPAVGFTVGALSHRLFVWWTRTDA